MDPSVQHLIELGYTDPSEAAATANSRRQQSMDRLKQAIELKRQARGQEAAALLVELTRDDSEWIAPRQLLAEIHYAAGDLRAAESQLDWLASHGVDQPRVALITAGIAVARRDLSTALAELEFARHVEPELASVNTLSGIVFCRLGRWDDAEDAFREAVRQDPLDARARDGLATVYLRHDELDDAVDWALRALEQDMQLFSAHYHLGIALMRLQQAEPAVSALEAATRVDPRKAAPYFWLSRICREQLNDEPRAARFRVQAEQIVGQRRARRKSALTST
jgi:tetratricopeptide (TPR) repeat protein